MAPKRSSIAAAASSTAAGSETSQRRASASAPTTFASRSASASPSSPRASIATRSPRAAKARAIARPSPAEAPVIATTRPVVALLHATSGMKWTGARGGATPGSIGDGGRAADRTWDRSEDGERETLRIAGQVHLHRAIVPPYLRRMPSPSAASVEGLVENQKGSSMHLPAWSRMSPTWRPADAAGLSGLTSSTALPAALAPGGAAPGAIERRAGEAFLAPAFRHHPAPGPPRAPRQAASTAGRSARARPRRMADQSAASSGDPPTWRSPSMTSRPGPGAGACQPPAGADPQGAFGSLAVAGQEDRGGFAEQSDGLRRPAGFSSNARAAPARGGGGTTCRSVQDLVGALKRFDGGVRVAQLVADAADVGQEHRLVRHILQLARKRQPSPIRLERLRLLPGRSCVSPRFFRMVISVAVSPPRRVTCNACS